MISLFRSASKCSFSLLTLQRLSTLKVLWTISSLRWVWDSSSSSVSISSLKGETVRDGSICLSQIFSEERLDVKSLWDFPTCIFEPFSVLKVLAQCSHWNAIASRLVASLSLESSHFFFKNISFLWWFLLNVEGLGFFFLEVCKTEEVDFILVSRLKAKKEPRVMEKEMVCPILASAWKIPGTGTTEQGHLHRLQKSLSSQTRVTSVKCSC